MQLAAVGPLGLAPFRVHAPLRPSIQPRSCLQCLGEEEFVFEPRPSDLVQWRKFPVAAVESVAAVEREPAVAAEQRSKLAKMRKAGQLMRWAEAATVQPGQIFESGNAALDNLNEVDSRFVLPQRYSSKDWFSIMLRTPESRVLKRVSHPVLAVTAWSLLLWVLQRFLPAHYCPRLTGLPHNLVGSALSLLLVFRTNAAYTRFWEGRQRWQMLSDHVRSLSRLCMLYREQLGAHATTRMGRLLCAFPVVLKQYLRGAESIDASVAHLLAEADRASLMRTRNKPLHACNLLAQQISDIPDTPLDPTGRTFPFSSRERLAMLSQVAALSDCIGACERIVQTPVPLHYARHTSRLATIFIFTLPFVLTAEMGLLTVPCMATICWALFGIQEIGLIIEEPFGKMLELDSICKSIQHDVRETLPFVPLTRPAAR